MPFTERERGRLGDPRVVVVQQDRAADRPEWRRRARVPSPRPAGGPRRRGPSDSDEPGGSRDRFRARRRARARRVRRRGPRARGRARPSRVSRSTSAGTSSSPGTERGGGGRACERASIRRGHAIDRSEPLSVAVARAYRTRVDVAWQAGGCRAGACSEAALTMARTTRCRRSRRDAARAIRPMPPDAARRRRSSRLPVAAVDVVAHRGRGVRR